MLELLCLKCYAWVVMFELLCLNYYAQAVYYAWTVINYSMLDRYAWKDYYGLTTTQIFFKLSNPISLCPIEKDWQNVETLTDNLEVFYDATNILSGIKYPTLNIFFPEYCEVYLTIKKMLTSPYPFVIEMSKEIRNGINIKRMAMSFWQFLVFLTLGAN
jgi:hypothetical protein